MGRVRAFVFKEVLLLHLISVLFVIVQGQSVPKLCPNQEAILPCRCLLRDTEYQVWCSHSDLPRVLDGLKSLSQFISHPIDELILENNNLPSLPGKAFLPLKVMRLMLRYNNLERVSNGWLHGLEDSLMELFIVEPDLRSLPDESLINQNLLQAVTIQSNTMKRLPQFSSLPKLRYIKTEGSNIVELSPRHFRNLPSLEKVQISGSVRLDKLEAGLFQDLPRLKLVNISNCGISWMHLRSISRLPALKELSLEGNKIQDASVVGRAARDLPALEILKLDHNLISTLGEAAFVDLPSLKKLSLSNNEIVELLNGAFHRVPELRSLDLNNNRVRRVHPEAFLQRSGSGIEELFLTNNDISHVAELRAILDALPRLTFLDMSYNNLEAIPFGALRGHPTLEYLRLDFNKLHIIDREAFLGMPALRELRLKNNSLSDRLEAPFWNLPALKGLDMSGNYFRRITPRLLSNVPELRKVDFSSNQINFVDPAAFLMTASLEHVNLSENALVTLHPATFRHLLNLYELDVSQNELMEFVPGLPRGVEYLFMSRNSITNIPHQPSPDLDLPQLKMLDLSRNTIQRIPPGVFRTVPQLRKLYLGRNALQGVDDNALSGLSKLEVLDLRANRISKLNPNILKDTNELLELNLRENRLDVLIPDALSGAENIRKLDISRNQLTEILSGTLEHARELEAIDASHNSLVHLPSGLYGMKKLRKLDLTDNRLNNVNPDTLSSLTSLEELKMSHNFIQSLRRGAFDNLLNLKILDLDNNDLQEIESKAIHALPQLKNLKLSQNKLIELPNAAFSNLPSLQTAELQDNELKLIGANAFHHVPHLVMLNISRNQFSGLEDAGLRSLRSLEMLDLSNNQLGQVSSPSLARMEWLVELRMDNNKICSVQGATFNGMPRLRVLSLRNNKMMSFPEHVIQKLRGNIAVLDIDGNPLACQCSLLWLRAWLQEQQLMGPRCLDGTLLREVRLSRQECQAEERHNDPVAPGCEAELLTAPGSYGTSQVYTQQWQNLRHPNKTKQHFDKNQLAPSPEESDYFYDEYIDYPYNETLVHAQKHGQQHQQQQQQTGANQNKKFSSPHLIPGDTPVIYAASSKNRTKVPDTPKGVVGSPSSSGFTFFGLPLPSLNLNNLLGAGSNRVDKGKMAPPNLPPIGPGVSVGGALGGNLPNAERKAAIVNKPNKGNTPQLPPLPPIPSLPQTLPTVASRPPPPPDLPERHNIIGMMPPSHPEIYMGGFVPLLPGSGGFTPMESPIQDEIKTSASIKSNFTLGNVQKVNITRLTTTNAQIDPTNQPHSTPSFISKRGPITQTTLASKEPNNFGVQTAEASASTVTPLIVTQPMQRHPTPEVTKLQHTTPEIITTTELPDIEVIEGVDADYEDDVDLAEDQIDDTTATVIQVQSSTIKPQVIKRGPQINDNFDEIFKEVVDVPGVPILATPASSMPLPVSKVAAPTGLGKPVTQAPIQTKPNANIEQVYINQRLRNDSDLETSHSSATTYDNNVIAPLLGDLEISSTGNNFDFDEDDEDSDQLSPMAHNRETRPDSTTEDMNWYFANYNKTSNIEPYVGGGIFPSSTASIPNSSFTLCYLIFAIKTVFSLMI
ncbi:protein artichoke isoform X2 [Atheta coriaria]|uniref:protein artichoke isoform X2 n=1 Tax=Dalotia coriaria TaxID=877792 RepID=UPI0031F37BB2